ncbi:MAG: MiaB/RimO family radical SAM methylthiotransferase [Thermoflexaceae bacterium]|nr:MiaB/RimO family radical SAM methylthiotransferase [Thermoflexaceae bacterium]
MPFEVRSRPLAAVLTLGCKLNLADSDEIAGALRLAGFDVVGHVCEADAFVVNTCSVTHVADKKSRRLVRSVRRLAPGAAVAVTGCFPQSAGFEAVQALGADFVGGTRDTDKAALVRFLAARGPASSPAPAPAEGRMARAFIKAQEGCNDVCAFCIVPRTRGREESRTPAQVAAEVARVVEEGAREVVITGTQLGAWGRDLPTPLAPHHLIAALLERTEAPRIRFSSLQPQDITPPLLALWGDPRLMPHFHLALQSGSERVLSAMRRRYTAAEFRAAAARIRAMLPDAAITTDVIAGFPGRKRSRFREHPRTLRRGRVLPPPLLPLFTAAANRRRPHARPTPARREEGAHGSPPRPWRRAPGPLPSTVRRDHSSCSLGGAPPGPRPGGRMVRSHR